MTVTADEFLRRFLLHMLPGGFVRIRFCGFLANRRRGELLPLCRQLLQVALRPQNPTAPDVSDSGAPGAWRCPHCGKAMILIDKLTPQTAASASCRAGELR